MDERYVKFGKKMPIPEAFQSSKYFQDDSRNDGLLNWNIENHVQGLILSRRNILYFENGKSKLMPGNSRFSLCVWARVENQVQGQKIAWEKHPICWTWQKIGHFQKEFQSSRWFLEDSSYDRILEFHIEIQVSWQKLSGKHTLYIEIDKYKPNPGDSRISRCLDSRLKRSRDAILSLHSKINISFVIWTQSRQTAFIKKTCKKMLEKWAKFRNFHLF